MPRQRHRPHAGHPARHRSSANLNPGADEVLAVHASHHSAAPTGTAETQLRVGLDPQHRPESRPPQRVLGPVNPALLQLPDVICVQLDQPMVIGVLEHPRIDQLGQLLAREVVPTGIRRLDILPCPTQQVIGHGHALSLHTRHDHLA